MRTARFSGRLVGGGGVCTGVCLPRGCLPRGLPAQGVHTFLDPEVDTPLPIACSWTKVEDYMYGTNTDKHG